TFVERSVHEVWTTLGIAFARVVLVIYLFLRDVRSTLIPAIAVPVSIIGTFAILHVFGYSVNILTMLALVLAIGVVVDDAIVVLENIFRHIEQGEKPLPAAFKAMDEIAFAIIAITVSLVAVFAPLAFQKSQTGLLLSFVISPRGATSEYTSRMVNKVENILKQTPEVELYGSVVALAMNGPGEADQGVAFVHFKERRRRTVQEIVRGPGGLQSRFINEVEGAIAIPQIPKAFTRGFGAPFQVTVQSQDLDALNRYAGELVTKLQQLR